MEIVLSFIQKSYIVHGIEAKLVSNGEKNMLYTKGWQILRLFMFVLTSLKASYLACKCVFHMTLKVLKCRNKIYTNG